MFLGQTTLLPTLPATARQMPISRAEAEMIVRIVESVIEFMKAFPLEFHSYCPMERWTPVLERVGRGTAEIERQLAAGSQSIYVAADTLFALTDLEECVSGAREARLSSAKTAMFISAGAAIGETLFGFSWLSLPAYIISLALVLGRPLITRVKESPSEPFRVDSLGSVKPVNPVWVEYTGPRTGGTALMAGPFPSTRAAARHAEASAGFSRLGDDGWYNVYDRHGNVL